jgi:hypothetical protein
MTSLDAWLAERSREDDRLYARYGKPLEPEHTGEWVAIGPAGEVIIGSEDIEVAREASRRFGDGNYAVRRIGWPYDYKIRRGQE